MPAMKPDCVLRSFGKQAMRVLRLLLFALALTSVGDLRAQSYFLHIHRTDGNDSLTGAILKLPLSFTDQTAALDYLQHIVPRLQEAGYLSASVDSFAINGMAYEAWIYAGEHWRWAKLSLNALPPGLVVSSGITEQQYAGRPLNASSLSRLTERVLHWCEDNGYPFARAGLDSITQEGAGINARLSLETGPLCRIDSVIIEGNVRLSKSYLMRYLDIREGSLYNESHLRKINSRLRELPFLQEGSSSRIVFHLGNTHLHLNLQERPANLVNGLIGLQPNTAETGKFLLTVDAQAALQNILGSGESISFSYQNLQPKSPRIKAEFVYPYLFGTPFGADGHFDLYFRSTEFRRTTFDAGGRYALSAQDFLRLYYRGNSNRVITPDTAYILTYHRLPANIDINSGGPGAEVQLQRTDYRLNPSRGWTLRFSGEVLHRSIRRNDGITGIKDGSGFDYSKLYDTLDAESYQYHVGGDASAYFSLAKRIVLKTAYAGGWISGGRLFQNELYQIGGFRLLRGFDEGSLFVNQYHVATLELRFLLGRNSNVYFFSDNAWLQSRINGFTTEGIYNGFGLGTSLETKTGVFTIAYGVGRSPNNPIQLRQSKIHIGYAAYF
jgi:outer membrane protein assembly factor BamA